MANDHHAISVPVTTLWREPSAVRPVDEPAVVGNPDPRAWPAALGKQERLDLLGRVDSQLLLGEPVEIVGESGDWLQVIAPWQPSSRDVRGYPGWVPRAHVAPAADWTGREFVVTVDSAPLEHDDRPSRPAEATFATVLPVRAESDGRVLVTLPGGSASSISTSSGTVRDTPEDRTTVPVDPATALARARRFIGLPYLWSGTSAFGLDCSGIVHINYRSLGRVVPRDAHDQADTGNRLPASSAEPGDLFFFTRDKGEITHVGFAVGMDDRMLHAPLTGNSVIDEPMSDDLKQRLFPFAVRLSSPS